MCLIENHQSRNAPAIKPKSQPLILGLGVHLKANELMPTLYLISVVPLISPTNSLQKLQTKNLF